MCLSIEWRRVADHYKSLCSILPHNYQSTIDKLKTMTQFLKDGGKELSKLTSSSSSADVRKINEKIMTYLIVKLCYNNSDTSLVRLMDESTDSTDTTTGIQQIRCSEYSYVRHRSDATSHSRVFCEYVSHNDTLIEYSRAPVEGKLHS